MAERDEEERRAQEELAKKAGSRIELEKKIAKMLRHMDHLERAKREEEVPLLQAAMLDKAKVDEQHHIQEQARFAKVHRAAWETDVVEKRRLIRMWEDKELFGAQIMQRRAAEFAQLKVSNLGGICVGGLYHFCHVFEWFWPYRVCQHTLPYDIPSM